MNQLFKMRIRLYHTIFLPFWWHRIIVGQWHPAVLKTVSKFPTSTLFLNYAIKTAICFCDKQFLDQAFKAVDLDSRSINEQWQAYLDIGMALYDLGDRDRGIDFLEQAVKISLKTSHSSISLDISLYQFCSRLNAKDYWNKRLEYALEFVKRFKAKEEVAKILLAKSYTDMKRFGEAEEIINELMAIHPIYKSFLAELYFSKGDYQSAASYLGKYPLSKSQYDWHAQYDYKEAISYFKTGQIQKWKNRANMIGRRLAWDKFYTLDYLEDEGVERIPEIDQAIERSRQKKRIIYVDKLSLCLERLPWLLWKTYLMYPYEVLFLAAGTIFLIMLIRAFFIYT